MIVEQRKDKNNFINVQLKTKKKILKKKNLKSKTSIREDTESPKLSREEMWL